MFLLFNNIIIALLPFIPKFIIKLISNRYIAGVNDSEVLYVTKKINQMNLSVTIDILGEHTTKLEEAKTISENYIKLYKNIRDKDLDCNISLKPSHIGLDINYDVYNSNLINIHNESINCNNFLRLDMENSKLTDLTIKSFKERYKINNNIGTVIQAYLFRSLNDINNLKEGMNIRLCKGIYNESSKIALKEPAEVNNNYLTLLKAAFNKKVYVGIATHDIDLINEALRIITDMKVDKNYFEFQVLYGVPMGNMINYLLNKQYKVRVYVPYGNSWYDYSIRRLRENPNISKYIIKNLFKRNFYK